LAVLAFACLAVSYDAANQFVTLSPKSLLVRDDEGRLYTPDNMTENPLSQVAVGEIGACLSEQLEGNFSLYSADHGWALVRFPSRPTARLETAELAAWWLPAANITAPRVVVGHGYGRNFDASYVQYVAYFLRSIGISALVLNYRDHGLSANTSTHHSVWGWSYPDDMLGAWDYAVHDPDGLLGGPLEPGQVGLLGFSMGGFVAATAFGLEPRVPAVWLESAAFSVEGVLAPGIAQHGA